MINEDPFTLPNYITEGCANLKLDLSQEIDRKLIIDEFNTINIINKSPFTLPEYATEGSAGMDLKLDLSQEIDRNLVIGEITIIKSDHTSINDKREATNPVKKVIIHPQTRIILNTGLYIQLPNGYEAQIRPRSGASFKKGYTVLNSPGTIDCDYTGQIGIIIGNFTDKSIELEHGERIAQMVISRYEKINWNIVESLNKTERGDGGFGHTGKK